MSLNKTVRGTERTVENVEGYEIYKEEKHLELFKRASNLKPKGEFYKDETTNVKDFVDFVRNFKDNEYVTGLSLFLNDIGIRFSPVVMTSVINTELHADRARVARIFDRPDKIANAFALEKHFSVKLSPSFQKETLRPAFEALAEHTLKKQKLLGKEFKTRDLIKMLHPKPRNDKLSALYKSLIENSKLSKLTKEETLVSVKSSTELTEAEKLDYFVKNVEKIPINQLIRNLRSYELIKDYATKAEVKTKLVKRLSEITEGDADRVLNVFDLISVAIEVPSLQDEMNEVIRVFINKVKTKAELDWNEHTYVLFDVSGSMNGRGIDDGFKYLVLLAHLIPDLDICFFADDLVKGWGTDIVPNIQRGRIDKAKEELNETFHKFSGGTALHSSFIEMARKYPEMKAAIVVSDEMTWNESQGIDDLTRELRAAFKGPIMLVNPVTYSGTCFRDKQLAIASLDPKIFYYLKALKDFPGFVKLVRNYGKE